FRVGGRESVPRYAGSFKTARDARERQRWVDGELAAMRVPDLAVLVREPVTAKTVRAAADAWRGARIDGAEGTRGLHRTSLSRVLRILGDKQVNQVTADDVAMLVEKLAAAGEKRETIRKSVKYLAAVLDYEGVTPNPCRDKQRIRLPHEEQEEIAPPTAEHVQ